MNSVRLSRKGRPGGIGFYLSAFQTRTHRATMITNLKTLYRSSPISRGSRFISTKKYSSSTSQERVLGEFKDFSKPSWSVQEKLLGKNRQSNSPSKVTESDLKRIANLSYLTLPENKIEKLTSDMDNILKCVASMEEVNTNNVEPLLCVLEDFSLKTRPDEPRPTTNNSGDYILDKSNIEKEAEQIASENSEWGYVDVPEPVVMQNATLKELGFFVVPKQKQPWEEEQSQVEDEDTAALRNVQRK